MGLDVLYLLIPVTFLLAAVALGMFLWAIRTGQFDDLETPAIRILFDDPAFQGIHEEEAPAPGGFSSTTGEEASAPLSRWELPPGGAPAEKKKPAFPTPKT